jgi:hypothetical protein
VAARLPSIVDAADVQGRWTGSRCHNSFHHFPPDVAERIRRLRKRRAIVVVEGIRYRSLGLLAMPLQLPAILLPPLSGPVADCCSSHSPIPLLRIFDGVVSMLRLHGR